VGAASLSVRPYSLVGDKKDPPGDTRWGGRNDDFRRSQEGGDPDWGQRACRRGRGTMLLAEDAHVGADRLLQRVPERDVLLLGPVDGPRLSGRRDGERQLG
jgi:hypothetical protein